MRYNFTKWKINIDKMRNKWYYKENIKKGVVEMLTPEQKRAVESIKNNPDIKLQPGMTDEEILAQQRFVQGETTVYNSEEEWRAAMKRQKSVDEIKEV